MKEAAKMTKFEMKIWAIRSEFAVEKNRIRR